MTSFEQLSSGLKSTYMPCLKKLAQDDTTKFVYNPKHKACDRCHDQENSCDSFNIPLLCKRQINSRKTPRAFETTKQSRGKPRSDRDMKNCDFEMTRYQFHQNDLLSI